MSSLVESRSSILLNKRPGRQFGAKNKASESIRWGFVEAYRQLGGVDGLVKWGKQKPDLFYPMLKALLPAELAESGAGQQIRVIVYGQTPSSPTNVIDLNTTTGSGQDGVSERYEAQAIDNIAMSDHAPNLGPR